MTPTSMALSFQDILVTGDDGLILTVDRNR